MPTRPLPLTGAETGVDVGLKVFLVPADGQVVENPRHHRRGEQRVAKAQRRVSRRTQGSHRRRKAVACRARAHQTVKRRRADFHHKTALVLVRQYDTIYHEAIQTANLTRRPAPMPDENGGHLPNGAGRKGASTKASTTPAGATSSPSSRVRAACAGKRVEAVPPAYTSQDCSGCGERVPKSLSVHTHVCPSCGLVLDRDENAARNIQWRGQRLRGLAELSAGTNREPMGLWPPWCVSIGSGVWTSRRDASEQPAASMGG